MKTYIKGLLVVVVVFAIAVPLVVKGPDGRPVMSLSDWFPDADEALGMVRQAAKVGEDFADDSIGKITVNNSEASDTQSQQAEIENAPTNLRADSGKMYKWQDAQGRWHFSSQKPADAQSVKLADLPQVENVMDAPVEEESNGSMMGLPSLGDAGDILEKVQRMAAERDQ